MRGFNIFPKGISPKVNVIVPVEFELVYFEVAVQRLNHYAAETSPMRSLWMGSLIWGSFQWAKNRNLNLLLFPTFLYRYHSATKESKCFYMKWKIVSLYLCVYAWFGFMAYQPLLVIQCQILFLHIYQIYVNTFFKILTAKRSNSSITNNLI